MANTYTQIYLHIVYAVKYRECLIRNEYEDELHKYFATACTNHKCRLLAIGGMPDHIHLLVSMHPAVSPSDLLQSIKISSSIWMKERFKVEGFYWQKGFSAFSYSRSMLETVKNYIHNQKTHHETESFHDEIHKLLDAAEIDYKEDYILKDVMRPDYQPDDDDE